jgi:uncharacterized protein YjbI with pentapeptide repeats
VSDEFEDFNITAREIIERYRAGERQFDDVELAAGDSFSGATLTGAKFNNAWLHSTNFRGADLRNATFRNSCLKCIDFSGADLRNARFETVAFCGSTFAAALIEGASVSGADWYGCEIADLSDLVEKPKDS